MLDTLFSFVAPHGCVVCNRDGALLCAWCAPDAFTPVPSRCYRCKRFTVDSSTCTTCRRPSRLTHVWVRTEYAGAAKQLLHAYKFERARAGAPLLAQAMLETLPFLPKNTLVVPIPTATSRVRQRGYDQTVLLADHIAGETDLRTERVAARITQSRQVGARREQRLRQLEAAFLTTKPSRIKGKRILLIDDVITTGTTLETMARNLKKAGAKSVSALVFAQKQ